MFDFIGYILSAPLKFAKRFLKSPLSYFFYSLVSRWYIIVSTLMVVVVYWVLAGLNSIGFFSAAIEAFGEGAKQIKAVAQHCTPLIKEPKKLYECISNPGEYIGDKDSNKFEDESLKQIEEDGNIPINDERIKYLSPYDEIILKSKS